jgi:hypothetical protein
MRLLLSNFTTAEVRHVKRISNKAAHGLAREAVKNCDDNIWMDDCNDNIWMEKTLLSISESIDLECLALVI